MISAFFTRNWQFSLNRQIEINITFQSEWVGTYSVIEATSWYNTKIIIATRAKSHLKNYTYLTINQ